MRNFIILLVGLFICSSLEAADSLQISFSKQVLKNGDTLDFRCYLPYYATTKLTNATLHVWIEDVEKKRRWKFRYPIVNGEVLGSLLVENTIPEGRYAFNFMIQRGYCKVSGEVIDHDKKEVLINYMMVLKNKKGTYIDNTAVDADGKFKLKSTLFEDSAYFIFSPIRKTKTNYLSIKIETPLDSAFTPVYTATRFITIGEERAAIGKKKDSTNYQFQAESDAEAGMLPGVTVTGKYKKKVQQYDEQYASGLFKRNDALVFDGIESDEISRSINVLTFLQGKVPGLMIRNDANGLEVAQWRNETVEIYIDEFRVEAGEQDFVTPSEIAMIKVFRPPAQLSSFSGGAGAIAIYTKKGAFANTTRFKHHFIVKGYSSFDSAWR
jgi:hypothetical protein